MMGKKNVNLSWDAFQAMGNPDNAPEDPVDEKKSSMTDYNIRLRVFLDRKSRGGKEVTVVRGFGKETFPAYVKDLGKQIKSKCGVGGSVKDKEILVQGNNRDRVVELLIKEGFRDVKKAGG